MPTSNIYIYIYIYTRCGVCVCCVCGVCACVCACVCVCVCVCGVCVCVCVYIYILSSTNVLNIDSNHCFLSNKSHIRMISEGSCDTEYWINGLLPFSFASRGINKILKYIKVDKIILNWNYTVFHNSILQFLLLFLVNIRYFYRRDEQILPTKWYCSVL